MTAFYLTYFVVVGTCLWFAPYLGFIIVMMVSGFLLGFAVGLNNDNA